jgi:gliding motility-associated-like protein
VDIGTIGYYTQTMGNNYTTGSNAVLYQYDLASGNPSTFLSSRTAVETIPSFTLPANPNGSTPVSFFNSFGALQLAPDKKIYVTSFADNSSYLGCIPCPDAPAPFCGYIDSAVYLGLGIVHRVGLPNFISSSIVNSSSPIAITYSNTCTVSATTFSLTNNGLNGVTWSFGDPLSGANNTSTLVTASHTYSTVGSYTVNAITGYSLCPNTVSSVLTIVEPPIINLGIDTALCPSNSILVSINNTYTNYVWQNGVTNNPTQNITNPGKYWVTVTNSCGSVSDSINVQQLLNPASNINDTILCLPQDKLELTVTSTTLSTQTYAWYNGATTNSITINQSGVYWVTITNRCGSVNDTFNVDFNDCSISTATEIIIPNIITANNDNVNDVFKINGLELGKAALSIFDRWGKLVFDTENYNNDWTPSALNDGTYYYVIDYPVTSKTYKGFVTIFNN